MLVQHHSALTHGARLEHFFLEVPNRRLCTGVGAKSPELSNKEGLIRAGLPMFLIKSLLQPFPASRINKAGHFWSSLCASSPMGNAFCMHPPRAAPSPATHHHVPHRVPHRVLCPSTGLQGGRRPRLLHLPPHLQRHRPGLCPRGQRGSGRGPPGLGRAGLRAGDTGTRQQGGGSAVRLSKLRCLLLSQFAIA